MIGGMGPAGPPGVTPPQPSSVAIAQQIASLGWAIVLIVAAAMTFTRKPLGRTLHLIWAIGAMALAIWGLSIARAQHAQMIQQMREQGSEQQVIDLAQSAMPFALGCSGVFTLAWPVFCLIWFGLVKRSTASMTR